MTAYVRNTAMSPRFWVGLAAVCLVASLLLGYHNAQMAADRAIAIRATPPPPPVLLQNFDAEAHANATKDVRVFAEVDPGAPVAVTVTAEDGSRHGAVLFPLYPVSEVGRAKLLTHLNARNSVPRPVKRPDAALPPPEAIGLVVRFAADEAEAVRQADVAFGAGLAGGLHGRVVEIRGSMMAPGNLRFVAQGAIAAMGGALAEGFLSIQPPNRSFTATLTPPPTSPLQSTLHKTAVVAGLLSVLLTLAPSLGFSRPPGRDEAEISVPMQPGHRSFSPIATQDEISKADALAAAESVSAFERAAGQGLDALRQRIRSRL